MSLDDGPGTLRAHATEANTLERPVGIASADPPAARAVDFEASIADADEGIAVDADAAIDADSGSDADAPAASSPTASTRPRRPGVLESWSEFQVVLRIVASTIAAWLVVTVAVGLTFGLAVGGTIGSEFAQFRTTDLDPVVVASRLAMFSSLVAGLGLRTLAASLPFDLALVPLGSLAVIAIVAGRATRRAMRRRPPAGIGDLFIRITLAAAISAFLIYAVAAIAILVYANDATPPTGLLPVAPPTADIVSVSPSPDALLCVLFPLLWVAVALGVFSLAPARALVGPVLFAALGPTGSRFVRGLAPAGVAMWACVRALLVLSVLLVVGAAAWLMTHGADPWDVGYAIPTLLAMGPNALLGLALGATGGAMGYVGTDQALWRGEGWAIGAGIAALVVPPLVSGFMLRVRRVPSTPGQVGFAGLAVALFELLAVNVAAPSARSVTTDGSVHGVRMLFDFGEVALVGGVVIVALVTLGYVLGTVFAPVPSDETAPALSRS